MGRTSFVMAFISISTTEKKTKRKKIKTKAHSTFKKTKKTTQATLSVFMFGNVHDLNSTKS